jgi:hypothetical protein
VWHSSKGRNKVGKFGRRFCLSFWVLRIRRGKVFEEKGTTREAAVAVGSWVLATLLEATISTGHAGFKLHFGRLELLIKKREFRIIDTSVII